MEFGPTCVRLWTKIVDCDRKVRHLDWYFRDYKWNICDLDYNILDINRNIQDLDLNVRDFERILRALHNCSRFLLTYLRFRPKCSRFWDQNYWVFATKMFKISELKCSRFLLFANFQTKENKKTKSPLHIHRFSLVNSVIKCS